MRVGLSLGLWWSGVRVKGRVKVGLALGSGLEFGWWRRGMRAMARVRVTDRVQVRVRVRVRDRVSARVDLVGGDEVRVPADEEGERQEHLVRVRARVRVKG